MVSYIQREQTSVPPICEAEAIGRAAKKQRDLAGSLCGRDSLHHTEVNAQGRQFTPHQSECAGETVHTAPKVNTSR